MSENNLDWYSVRRLALIYSKQAEIEGMKAENEVRKSLEQSMAYNYNDFQIKANELLNLAYQPDETL